MARLTAEATHLWGAGHQAVTRGTVYHAMSVASCAAQRILLYKLGKGGYDFMDIVDMAAEEFEFEGMADTDAHLMGPWGVISVAPHGSLSSDGRRAA